MHHHPFKISASYLAAVAIAIGSGLSGVQAQTAVTPAAGFNDVICLGNSDTLVTTPFHQAPVFRGTVDTAPVTAGGGVTLALLKSPGWAVDEFAETHYIEILSGAATGLTLPITANGAATVTVDAASQVVSQIEAGTSLRIVPNWTVATLFPPASQETFHPSSGMKPDVRGTELLLFSQDIVGSGLVPDRILFVTATNWYNAADLSIVNDLALPPHSVFVIRHQPGVADTVYQPFGFVDNMPNFITLAASSLGEQDNIIGLMRPIPVNLNQLGLLEPDIFRVSRGLTDSDRRDEVLVFDNTVAGYDKAPSARYFVYRDLDTDAPIEWRQDIGTDTFPSAGDVLLPRGAVIVIRKAKSSGAPKDWLNLPNYDATAAN
jgi:uncharacterized protein (TIGR02597 family)